MYLISGGFHQIVDHVANQLGIPLDRVFANRLLFDEQGKGLFASLLSLCFSCKFVEYNGFLISKCKIFWCLST